MSSSRLVAILLEGLVKDSEDLVVLMGFTTRLDKEEVKVVDNHSEISSKSLRNSLAVKVDNEDPDRPKQLRRKAKTSCSRLKSTSWMQSTVLRNRCHSAELTFADHAKGVKPNQEQVQANAAHVEELDSKL
jgi:hypothetical protein